jgi:hypothetical protein
MGSLNSATRSGSHKRAPAAPSPLLRALVVGGVATLSTGVISRRELPARRQRRDGGVASTVGRSCRGYNDGIAQHANGGRMDLSWMADHRQAGNMRMVVDGRGLASARGVVS